MSKVKVVIASVLFGTLLLVGSRYPAIGQPPAGPPAAVVASKPPGGGGSGG